MIRAFLAVPLDEAMRARYSSLHAGASRRFKGLRWVRPENTHVTLRFLGEAVVLGPEDLQVRVATRARKLLSSLGLARLKVPA